MTEVYLGRYDTFIFGRDSRYLFEENCGELASQSCQSWRFEPVLQIVQIRKSISYVRSERKGTTNPSSSVRNQRLVKMPEESRTEDFPRRAQR